MEKAVREFDPFSKNEPPNPNCTALSLHMMAVTRIQLEGAFEEALELCEHALRFTLQPSVRNTLVATQSCAQGLRREERPLSGTTKSSQRMAS
jgi:hypothetical protein